MATINDNTQATDFAKQFLEGLISMDEMAQVFADLVTLCPHTNPNKEEVFLKIPAGEFCEDCGKTLERKEATAKALSRAYNHLSHAIISHPDPARVIALSEIAELVAKMEDELT